MITHYFLISIGFWGVAYAMNDSALYQKSDEGALFQTVDLNQEPISAGIRSGSEKIANQIATIFPNYKEEVSQLSPCKVPIEEKWLHIKKIHNGFEFCSDQTTQQPKEQLHSREEITSESVILTELIK